MKKLFAIAFTCVYLTLTVGVVRTTHYCMGRVNSSSLFSFETSKCACAIYAQFWGKTCCDEDSELIKIDNDQSASWIVFLTPAFFCMGISFTPDVDPTSQPLFLSGDIGDDPPVEDTPLFKKHCALIFYGDEKAA